LLDTHDAVNHGFRVLNDVQRAPLWFDEHCVHAEQIRGDEHAEVFDDLIDGFVQRSRCGSDDFEEFVVGIVLDRSVDTAIEVRPVQNVMPTPVARPSFDEVLKFCEDYSMH
jgi:hypothetical protein